MYNQQGVCGITCGSSYTFRKNIFGDITEIYQGTTCVAKYKYDAWGNCTVCNPDGTVNTSENFIGNLNPFRYRGYYWDKHAEMYYLQTRWYDPTVCRFISPDSYEYLDPTTFGGLNLYAYCLNNPIMYSDPSGCMPLLVIAIITSAISVGANIFTQMVFEDRAFSDIIWSEVIISGISGFLCGLIPGNNFLSLFGQSAISSLVENGIRTIWYGDEFSMKKVLRDTLTQVAIGTVSMGISYGANKLTTKITNKLFIKAPNYSQYQHYFRVKGLNYTREEVYEQMYRNIEHMTLTNSIVNFTFDTILDFVGELF